MLRHLVMVDDLARPHADLGRRLGLVRRPLHARGQRLQFGLRGGEEVLTLLSPLLGQPIGIENLFGAAGVEKGIKSAPDGYTIIYGGAGTLALLPHIKKVSYDGLKDLTPVGRFAISPTLLAVNPALPAKNVQELVALMKANPGKLKMSTAGAGTSGHFSGEMFIAMTGVKAEVIHFPGGGPAIDAIHPSGACDG